MPKEKLQFLDDYLAYLLKRASHLVSEEFSSVLKDNNMDRSQWRILASLSDYDNVPTGRLARIVLLKQPTLTKLLDRMEKEKLVMRQHSKEDRRSVKIAITDLGREKITPLLAKAKKHEETILEPYSRDEKKKLKEILNTLIDRMNALK